jgi:hypothetical protein
LSVPLRKRKAPEPARTILRHREAVIGRQDHGLGRSVVPLQRVEPLDAGAAGRQISVNVGTTKGVDRLFRIADEDQYAVGSTLRNAIHGIENPVLKRVGILEFVDQRHRKLLPDAVGEAFAMSRAQCGVEPREEVVETHLRTARLLGGKAPCYPACRVAQQVDGARRAGPASCAAESAGDRGQVRGAPGGWRGFPDFGSVRQASDAAVQPRQ